MQNQYLKQYWKEEREKKTVILRKRAVPKGVNLPNGRSFTTKWERINRKQLPINIRVKRQQTIGPKKSNRMIYLNLTAPAFRKIKARRKAERKGAQSVKGLGSNLIKAGFDLASKAISSEFGKKLTNKGIDNIPNIFKFGVSKIKNKNVKKTLSSDIVKMVVEEAQNRTKNKYSTLLD